MEQEYITTKKEIVMKDSGKGIKEMVWVNIISVTVIFIQVSGKMMIELDSVNK